jgi:hypothetical protein
MATERIVSIIFKSGKELHMPASAAEAATILGIFETYVARPRGTNIIYSAYNNGAGAARILLSDVSAVVSNAR